MKLPLLEVGQRLGFKLIGNQGREDDMTNYCLSVYMVKMSQVLRQRTAILHGTVRKM